MFKQLIYGTVVQVTGDKLGLHTLFGFAELCGARYFCLHEKYCLKVCCVKMILVYCENVSVDTVHDIERELLS